MTIVTTINIEGVELTVEYSMWYGRAATQYEPEEPAGLEIESISHGGVEIGHMISEDYMYKIEVHIAQDLVDSIDEDTPHSIEKKIRQFVWSISHGG